MVANCNVVRYLSALVCIQLVSLTHLYLISTDAPLDGGAPSSPKSGGTSKKIDVAISPEQQEQHEKDKLKTRDHLIAERNLLQAKLDQARRQLTIKDRKLRKIERQAAAASAGGDNNESPSQQEEDLPPPPPSKEVVLSSDKNTSEMEQMQSELALLKIKNEEKERKLKLAKEELKSTYSNFLVGVPQTTGESNSNMNANAEQVDEPFLLHHLQEHRAQLRSALTKYRVCHDSQPRVTAADDGSSVQLAVSGGVGGEDTLTRCWLHTVEDSYFTFAHARRFVVIRNPLTHVPALYQHCRQQQDSAAAVPSTLDQWLERDKSMTVPTKTKTTPKTGKDADEEEKETPDKGEEEAEDDDETTDDDDPREHAALRRKKKLDEPREEMNLVDECQFRNAPTDPQSRRVLHGLPDALQDDSAFVLQNLYAAVGLTDELFRTACLFSIAIHRRVPPQCDCSKGEFVVKTDEENDNDDGKVSNDNNNGEEEEAITPKFDDSFPITQEQSKAIARITTRDQQLYETAKQLFWEQVVRVEEFYDFRMC